MVQDDPHPIVNRKGHENGAGYRHQGGRQQVVKTIASTQGYNNGYGGIAQEAPPSQRQGNQSQNFMPKPNSNRTQGSLGSATINHGPYPTQEPSSQRQGSQPQSYMSNTNSTQAQGKIGGPTFHHGPSPTQPLTEGGMNQPHPTLATTRPLGPAYDNESRRKPYDDKLSIHGDSAHYQPQVASIRRTKEDGHDFEDHDWKSGASHEPKTVPSDALQLDHINKDKECNKLHTTNGKPSTSPMTKMVQDKPRIQVNVNVYQQSQHQPSPPRRVPPSFPAPAPDRHSHVRPPPPTKSSFVCCSIL